MRKNATDFDGEWVREQYKSLFEMARKVNDRKGMRETLADMAKMEGLFIEKRYNVNTNTSELEGLSKEEREARIKELMAVIKSDT